MQEGNGVSSSLGLVKSTQEDCNLERVASVLKAQPETIPALLLTLHFSRDNPQRFTFIQSLVHLLNGPDYRSSWHILAENDLKRSLKDIIRNKSLCGYSTSDVLERYKHDAQMQGYIADFIFMLVLYLAYLEHLIRFTSDHRLGDPEEADARELALWMSGLWFTLWDLRELLLFKTFSKRHRLNERFADLGDLYWSLQFYLTRAKLEDRYTHVTRFPYVMLATFVCSGSSSVRERSMLAFTALMTSRSLPTDEIVGLFRALCSSQGNAQRAMDTFRLDLEQRARRDGDVKPTIDLFRIWIAHVRPSYHLLPAYQHTDDILNVLITAYGRDKCSHYMPLVMVSQTIADCCLFIITRLLEFRTAETVTALGPLNAYLLLDLVSARVKETIHTPFFTCRKTIVPLTAPQDTTKLARELRLVFSRFGIATAIANRSESETTRLHYIETHVRISWQDTLCDLQRSMSSSHDNFNDMYKSMSAVARALGWIGNFAGGLENRLALEKLDEAPQGCHFSDCLCFGRRVKHRLYTCKGCGKASYCSMECQKLAWHEGHDKICPGGLRPEGASSSDRLRPPRSGIILNHNQTLVRC